MSGSGSSGILKALGAGPWRILGDVSAETFLMALVSTAAGGVLGSGRILVSADKGFEYKCFRRGFFRGRSGLSDPIWRASISLKTVLAPIGLMWVVCLIASLYPAIIAARLDPVKAITHV